MKHYTFREKLDYHMNRLKALEQKSKTLKLTEKEKQDFNNSKGFVAGHDFTWFEYTSKSKIDNTYEDLKTDDKLNKMFPNQPPNLYLIGFRNGKEGFRNELKDIGFEMFQDKKGSKKL